MNEPKKASGSTQVRIESTIEGSRNLSKSTFVPRPDAKIIVYKAHLFRMQIPYNKNAPFPSITSATMLNNYQYNLKLTRSVVPILDQ